MSNSPRSFQIQLDIQAPHEAVWQAISEAESIARWFAPTAVCEPRVGGRLLWQWGQMHAWEQTIEVFEPGAHLRTRYESAVDDGKGGKRPLFVDFHLEGKAGVTTLRLVHSGFGPEAVFDAEYHGISGGWPVELRSLRLYLERHPGRDRMLAWSAHSTTLAPEVAWQRLSAGLAVQDLPRLREGDRFELDVPGAGPISGTALYVPTAREFSGVAENLDDGWFRVHCEHWAGRTQAWLWLAVYSGPRSRVAAFQRAFDSLLRRLPAADDQFAGESA